MKGLFLIKIRVLKKTDRYIKSRLGINAKANESYSLKYRVSRLKLL